MGEQKQDPKVAAINWELLPAAEPEEAAYDGGHTEVWAHKRGESKGGGEKMNSVMFRTREHAVATHSSEIVDDPVLPDPLANRVQRLGNEIQGRKYF